MHKIYIDKLPEKHNKVDIINSLFKDSKTVKVEFIYDSKFDNTKHLRDFIEVVWEKLGFSESKRSRIILISDELNNNAIEYWTEKDWFNSLRLEIEFSDNYLDFCMEVEDMWNWKAPKSALDMETMRAHKLKRWYFNHDSIRWRGLFLIVVQIADRLYFKNSAKGWLIVGIKIRTTV